MLLESVSVSESSSLAPPTDDAGPAPGPEPTDEPETEFASLDESTLLLTNGWQPLVRTFGDAFRLEVDRGD